MTRVRLLPGLALTLLFVVLTLVMTFPEVWQLTTHSIGDSADGTLTQWIMRWDVHALLDREIPLFNANIYWPNVGTLAYMDSLIMPALVERFLATVVGSPLSYNLTYLLTWITALWSTYLLARWFTRDRIASFLAAIVFAFAIPRFSHYGHFNLNFSALIPLTIFLLLKFLEVRDWRFAVGLGLTLGAIPVTTTFYALPAGVSIAVLCLGWFIVNRGRPGRGYVVGMLGAAVLAGLVSSFFVLPYFRIQRQAGFERKAQPAFSADPEAFITPAEGSYLYGGLDRWATERGVNAEARLFPGILAVALASVGMVSGLKSRTRPISIQRKSFWILAALGIFFFVLAFGHRVELGGATIDLPYQFFVDYVPGFGLVRAPSRFVVIPLLVMSVLVAAGFSRLSRRLSPRAKTILAVLLGGLMMLEYAGPIQSVPKIEHPVQIAVNKRLAQLPPGPVVEMPVGEPRNPGWAYMEAPRMLASTNDWLPRVNGYSGFFPPGYEEVSAQLNQLAVVGADPGPGLEILNHLGVRYLVLRTKFLGQMKPGHFFDISTAFYEPEEVARVISAIPSERIAFVKRFDQAVLVGLSPR